MVYGFDLDSVLAGWDSYGVFDIVLPFLLIFSVVFGVLTATHIFGKNSRGINAVIAFVIGLMAVRFGRFGIVAAFFGDIFPRAAVGISVLLVLIILVSLFIPKEHLGGWMIGFYTVGGIIAIIVVLKTFYQLSWFDTPLWGEWGGLIIGALLVIGLIIAVSTSGKDKSSPSSGVTFGPIRTE